MWITCCENPTSVEKFHCHSKNFRLYFCVNIEYMSFKIVVKLQLESRTTGGMKSAAKFLWVSMDFYYLCIYRMVHRSILCSIGPGNFCKPGIFKWTVLSNLRMWSGDCCSCFDSAKGQPADIICGFFLTDFHFGIHYRIYSGESISQ